MSLDSISALILFAFVSSATPGPNNIMLLASGANYGFTRSIPHMLGISIGHAIMIILLGTVLANLFESYPIILQILKIIGIVYLFFLAYKIATSASDMKNKKLSKPFNFFQAASFQWVNPKAWAMALTAISVYAPSQQLSSILLVALIFCFTNLPSVSIWTIFGKNLKLLLKDKKKLVKFNILMSILLIASLFPIL
tara:strand:+ start:113 stop:700 length:588 start_codon:yes stop_codon:yes gene_type:complete